MEPSGFFGELAQVQMDGWMNGILCPILLHHTWTANDPVNEVKQQVPLRMVGFLKEPLLVGFMENLWDYHQFTQEPYFYIAS